MNFLSRFLALSLVVSLIFNTNVQVQAAPEHFPGSGRYYKVDQSGEPYPNDGGATLVYAQPGDYVNLWVTLRNMSTNRAAQLWYSDAELLDEGPQWPYAHVIGLGISEPRDALLPWLNLQSFVLNGNRLGYFRSGPPVAKGQDLDLHFQVKIADHVTPGDYNLLIAPVREFDEWGERVTANGKRHKYQSILWKFRISGSPVPEGQWIQEDTYGIEETVKGGQETLAIKGPMGQTLHVMPRDIAYKVSAGLRPLRNGLLDNGENIVDGSAVVNPAGGYGNSVLFATYETPGNNGYDYPSSVVSRIYSYDLDISSLSQLYESIDESDLAHQKGADYLRILGRSGTNLIVQKFPYDSSPGPCYDPWQAESSIFALDLYRPAEGLELWQVPAWKKTSVERYLERCYREGP